MKRIAASNAKQLLRINDQQLAAYGSKIIGIDLGTTNSCVSYVEGEGENAKPRIINNSIGKRTTPSIVAFLKNGERLVGEKAKRQAVTNAKHTVYKAKRLIGRRFSDEAIQKEREVTPYEIVEGPGGAAYVKAQGKTYSPAEIAANILAECKQTAEDHIGEEVTRAVITVPAYFNDSQRQATKDAGKIAGLTVERIINEPTAAALAYGLQDNDGLVAVYDMGGGTFDISILNINKEDGVCQVIATNGDTYLGGEDFDNVLVKYILDQFKAEEGIDLSKDTLALQRIREAAETIKISLSHVKSDEINLPYICTTPDGEVKNLQMTITEDELDNMTKYMVQKSLDVCAQCLRDAKLKSNEIDNVVLVGGMTRMPLIQTMVKNFFGKLPSKGVNPDEVVATGAALQGGILDGETTNTLMLFDVTPLSLGIELAGGAFSPIISKNTNIPYAQTKNYTTAQDNQTSVTVSVYQGERPIAKDNRLLGEFTLTDIPPAPKAVPQIDVTFSIDANGIVSVSAKDKASGSTQNITVQSSSGLSDDDINRMQMEAEKYAEEDKKRMEMVTLKNEVQTTVSALEDSMGVLGDGMSEDEQAEVRKDIRNLNSAMLTDNYDSIKSAYATVQQHHRNYSEKAYRARASSN